MDTARYYLALILVVTYPPAFAFWFVVHPFIDFWRRRGAWITYGVMFPAMIASCVGLYALREPLLRVQFGTSWVLVGLGAALYAAAAVVEVRCRRYLKLRTLLGVPEIKAPQEGPGTLLCEGIYARVRHPRYVGVMLGGFGVALASNYLAAYVTMLALVPVAYALTAIEETELLQRFGDDYLHYRARVPRFVPRPR
ncbi:MAG: isoprenylcysteine carboxylmethyltransferase family protein [Acidobacteriota bacterium]|jgi:protein-S-isoprenylcysteine O-methyltransferase Ste14